MAGVFSPYTLVNGVQHLLFDSPSATPTPPEGFGHGRCCTSARRSSCSSARWARSSRRYRSVEPVSTIVIDHVSRWYRNVVAVNDVSMTIGPGVTGLLGPNGAGKSTLIALMSGFLAPSTGTVTLDGEPLWRNESVYRHLGLVPEREALFDYLTGRQFVVAMAELHGLPDPGAAAQRALALIEMTDAQDRAISTYSKGMRQRVKMASALVHDPAVLLLDEPFNGMDPRQRLHLMDLLRGWGAEGRTVLFSSHILEEVEQVARQIEVVVSGRHAASGDFGAIRRLMTDRPNRFVLRTSSDRVLAAALLADPSVRGARLRSEGGIEVEASDFGRFSIGAARARPAARRTAAGGHAHRRVPGVGLRLPGVVVMLSPTIVRLGVRSIFGQWRGVLLFVLPVVLVGVSVLVRALVGDDATAARAVLYGLGLVLVVPLVALLATSGLLANEIDDGSIAYLLAKPLSRYTIVLSKLLVAVTCVLAVRRAADARQRAGPALLALSFGVGFGVASFLGGAAYCALFAWLSVMTRHAVVFGLIYLLVWEGLLGGLLDGIRWLSVTRWSAQVVDTIASQELVDDLPLAYALVALAVVLAAGVWRTGRRLQGFNLTGDE